MTIFLPGYLCVLKDSVLKKAAIHSISPSDCKNLSDLIYKKTGKYLSETTLKRVYGFATNHFNPSLFTINALAEFADHGSWEKFCHSQDELNILTSGNTYWEELKRAASKITGFSIQSVKARSGIPYKYSIERRFLDEHMDDFLRQKATATVLSAPAGYGKTIAMSKWIEQHTSVSKKDDIYLFFSSTYQSGTLDSNSLEYWLLSFLSAVPNTALEALLNGTAKPNGNLFLIVDGLDCSEVRSEKLERILNQINDVISLYGSQKWLKVVLVTRTATWLNYRNFFWNTEDKWFFGYMRETIQGVNIPLLNIREIEEICVNINPRVSQKITIKAAELLNYPFYLQLFYQNNAKDFSATKLSQFSIYELISAHILNKIYLGQTSSEKILLLQGLAAAVSYREKRPVINKLYVYDLIQKFKNAYSEIAGLGLIRDLNLSESSRYVENIEFLNSFILEYFIASTFLLENKEKFDLVTVRKINQLLRKSPHKLPVLKWCVFFLVERQNYENFDLLCRAELSPSEKSELIIFIGELFDRELERNPEAVGRIFSKRSFSELFDYFFGLEFINPSYDKTLEVLQHFPLTSSRKIFVITGLAVNAVNQLHIEKLEDYITQLKQFSNYELNRLQFNPLLCLETIYCYLKFGVIKKEALAEITKFYFSSASLDQGFTPGINEVMNLLAAYTLTVCQNPRKSLRFIDSLNKINITQSPGYSFLLKILTAEACLMSARVREGIELYNELKRNYNKRENTFTEFMRVSLYALKLKVHFYAKHDEGVIDELKNLVILCNDGGYKWIKFNSLAFILQNYSSSGKPSTLYSQANLEFLKTARTSGCYAEKFSVDKSVRKRH